MVGDRPARGVREQDRTRRGVERVVHGAFVDVGEVHEDAGPVHLADDVAAELREAVVDGFPRRRRGPRRVVVVGQRHVRQTGPPQFPQDTERPRDGVPALGADEGGDASGGHRLSHSGRRGRPREDVRVRGDDAAHHVDLFQHGDGRGGGSQSDGTYTDQNWAPTPPARSRGTSVCRVGWSSNPAATGSDPNRSRSSHARSLWPSNTGWVASTSRHRSTVTAGAG